MSAYFSQCREERYATISAILKSSTTIPILTTPGDNEWNRCPDSNLAVANYTKYFIGIEDQWKGTSEIAKMIKRSTTRPENWVFFYSKVLFLALNMVDEDDSTTGFDTKSRLQDNIKWFDRSCSKYCLDARGSYASIPLDVIIIIDTVLLTFLFLLPLYFSCNNFWSLDSKCELYFRSYSRKSLSFEHTSNLLHWKWTQLLYQTWHRPWQYSRRLFLACTG